MAKLAPHFLIIVAVFVAVSHAHANGTDDWDWYGWQELSTQDCNRTGGVLTCPTQTQKWDWKRDQWVDVDIAIKDEAITLSQRVRNNDSRDRDDVCVTVLFLDSAGQTLIVHHQNWSSRPLSSMERQFAYPATHWADVATIKTGSKQCRQGPHQDDAIYAGVLAGLPS